jgi:hypothetical protein
VKQKLSLVVAGKAYDHVSTIGAVQGHAILAKLDGPRVQYYDPQEQPQGPLQPVVDFHPLCFFFSLKK